MGRHGSRYSITSVNSRRGAKIPRRTHSKTASEFSQVGAMQRESSDESSSTERPAVRVPQAPSIHRTSQASSQFAELLDQAFNFEDLRAVSASLEAGPLVSAISEAPERRTVSEPTPAAGTPTLDPRHSLGFDFESQASAPEPPTHQYLLPMIFEEDRFADAVEEEVELKVYKRRRPQNVALGDDSQLQISNLASGESFFSYKPSEAAAAVTAPLRPAPQVPRPGATRQNSKDLPNRTSTVRKPVPPSDTRSNPPARAPLGDRSNQVNGSKPMQSFFRKLTPRRTRASPVIVESSEYQSEQALRSEGKQSWFMKFLNLAPPPNESGKTLLSTLTLIELRSVIVEVLEEWKRFGLTVQSVNTKDNVIAASISPRNVLEMRQSRFKIQMKPVNDGSMAVITQDRGSRKSFMRFVTELERVLDNMNVVGTPNNF